MSQEDLYAGSDPIDDDDLSALDRGDNLEAPSAEPEVEEPEVEAEEPEVEAEEVEAEAEEPEVEEPKPTRQPPNAKIPKSRFDEVNARRKAAEARAKELEEELERARGPQTPVDEFDFTTKEEEYLSAAIDGDFNKAKAIRAEIRKAEQELYRAEAQRTQSAAVSQTRIELDLKTTIQELEAVYPALDSKNEETYDELATSEVLELHNAYLSMGKFATPAESLRAAAELIAMKYKLQPAEEVEEIEETPPPRRKTADTAARRKAVAAAAQPRLPSAGSAGTASTMNIAEMSEAEFDALPESKKAELRGDMGL